MVDTAISPIPDTVAGLTAILTGHSSLVTVAHLPASLPRALSARGYRVRAVVALDGSDPELARILRDFDSVSAHPDWIANEVADAALNELATPHPAPLFLWVHFNDLNLPFRTLTGTRFEDAPFPADEDLHGLSFGGDIDARRDTLRRGVAHYDRLVGHIDVAIGRMADSLFWQDYMVLTAPHGRNLIEHEAPFHHGHDLFDASVRVPLVIVGPEVPDAREAARLWSLTDIAPMLLEGRRADRTLVRMQSLPRAGLDPDPPPWLLPTAWGPAGPLWGERTLGSTTLLLDPATPPDRPEGLRFELARDPEELRPVMADPAVLERINAWHDEGPH
jgi:hypothetical protein